MSRTRRDLSNSSVEIPLLSLNEYIVAYMVAGFTVETLPIKIFNSLRYGHTPVMACVAVAFVVLAGVVFGRIARFGDLPRLLGAWSPRERWRRCTRSGSAEVFLRSSWRDRVEFSTSTAPSLAWRDRSGISGAACAISERRGRSEHGLIQTSNSEVVRPPAARARPRDG